MRCTSFRVLAHFPDSPPFGFAHFSDFPTFFAHFPPAFFPIERLQKMVTLQYLGHEAGSPAREAGRRPVKASGR